MYLFLLRRHLQLSLLVFPKRSAWNISWLRIQQFHFHLCAFNRIFDSLGAIERRLAVPVYVDCTI